MKEKATFPAPFRWIYCIAYFVHKWQKGDEERRKKTDRSEKRKDYLKLLKELIQIQQQSKLESSEEDKLADLRKDLILEMEKMKNEILAQKS